MVRTNKSGRTDRQTDGRTDRRTDMRTQRYLCDFVCRIVPYVAKTKHTRPPGTQKKSQRLTLPCVANVYLSKKRTLIVP